MPLEREAHSGFPARKQRSKYAQRCIRQGWLTSTYTLVREKKKRGGGGFPHMINSNPTCLSILAFMPLRTLYFKLEIKLGFISELEH